MFARGEWESLQESREFKKKKKKVQEHCILYPLCRILEFAFSLPFLLLLCIVYAV